MAGANNKNGFTSNGSNLFPSYGRHLNGHEEGAGENEKDLKYLFYLLWDHKWIIASIIIICVLLAGLAAFLKTPIYQSSGTIMITGSQNQYSLGNSENDLGKLLTSSYGIGLGSSVVDELGILRSRNLSNEVADTLMKLRLMENGQQFPVLFTSYPDDSTMTSADTVAYRLRENLFFQQVDRESNLIDIYYESPSPLEAAHVINLTIDIYSQLSTRQNRKSANAAVDFLENERVRIEDRLHEAEQQMAQYMDENELVQVDAQTKSIITRQAELEQRRQQARTGLVAVNSAIDQYQQQLNSIKPGLADQYADAIGPNMQRLQYQLAELKTERMQMLAENPDLKNSNNPPARLQKLNRQIEDYQNEIRSQTEQLLSQSDQYLGFLGSQDGSVAENLTELNRKLIELKVEQQQFNSQVEVLNEEISQLNERFENLPENMTGLARLQRSVKINEELYLTVSKQHAEMSLWQQTQFGRGQLVDEGFVPEWPVSPDVPLYLLIGLVLGCIMGVGYVFVNESFNTRIDGVHKLKRFDLPLLSIIPDFKEHIDENHEGQDTSMVQGQKVSTDLVSLLDTVSPITESFRRLESNIVHSNPDHPLNPLMITSTTQGEGKTTVTANLGIVMAEADQKILIVDTDFRRPTLHKMFGLDRTPGIVDVLFESASMEDAIKPTPVPNLHMLCAGKRPPNPSAIAKSSAFLSLIKELEQRYDRVIFDTPPFGIITDSSSYMSQIGGIVVVTRFGETHFGELDHTLHNLDRVNANVVGTVLNGFESDKTTDYYYGNNYYKEFYGDYEAYVG